MEFTAGMGITKRQTMPDHPMSERDTSHANRTTQGRTGESHQRLFLVSILLLGFLAGCQRIWESDIFVHLTYGQWILHRHALPHHDIWSCSANAAITNNYWLFQLLTASLVNLGGFEALSLFKALGLALTALVLGLLIPRRRPDLLTSVSLPIALLVIQMRTRARPEIVTILLLVATIWIVESVRGGASRRRLWILPAIMILWVNMHSLYILGLGVIWMAVVGSWMDGRVPWRRGESRCAVSTRELLLPAGAATVACLVSPDPIGILIHPVLLWSQASGGASVYAMGFSELVPSYRDWHRPEFWATVALALTAAGRILTQRRGISWAHPLWLIAFCVTGAAASRNLALAALVSAAIIAVKTGPIPVRKRIAIAVAAAVVAVGLLYPLGIAGKVMGRAERPGFGLQPDTYPIGVARKIAQDGRPGDILTLDFGDASALIYHANRDPLEPTTIVHRLWIDGRSDIHDKAKYERLFSIREAFSRGPDGAAAADLPSSVRYVVVNFNDLEIIRNIAMSGAYMLFYLDRNQACFVVPHAASDGAERFDNLEDYDVPMTVEPPTALLGPTADYRWTWWHQYPLDTHWKLGCILPFLDRTDLAARYLECAEMLGEGPAADRRGMLAVVLADMEGGGREHGWISDSPGGRLDPLRSRALWLLEQKGVCDLGCWEGRTNALARIELLQRANALDRARDLLAEYVHASAGRAREDADADAAVLLKELNDEVAKRTRRLEMNGVTGEGRAGQAQALLDAGLPMRAIAILGENATPPENKAAGDAFLSVGLVDEARVRYGRARLSVEDADARAVLCDWAEGRYGELLRGDRGGSRGVSEASAGAMLRAAAKKYLRAECTRSIARRSMDPAATSHGRGNSE
jgi:hypothetical protein